MKNPAPRIRRHRPETRQLREQQNARIQSRHHGSGNQRAPRSLPAFGNQSDRIRPQPTDPEANQKPQHEHLFLRLHSRPKGCERRIENHTDPHRPRPANAVAQTAQHNPANRRPQHEGRRETCKPVASQRWRERSAQQAFGYGQRGDRHEPQFHAIEDESEKGDHEHQHALAARQFAGLIHGAPSGWLR